MNLAKGIFALLYFYSVIGLAAPKSVNPAPPPIPSTPTPTPKPTPTPPPEPTPPDPTPTPEVTPPTTDVIPTPQQNEKEEKELKHKVVPFFFLNFDWGNWTANLTPYKANPVIPAALTPDSAQDRMVLNNFRDGVQKTGYIALSGGLGARVKWWYDNASGVAKEWWGYVGLAPLIGRQMNSVRYYRSYEEAQNSPGYKSVPGTASGAMSLSQGDSVTYLSTGGVIFAAGTGLSVVGVGTIAIAHGTWETYIEKVDNERVYVKITKGTLSSLSVSTGAAIVQVSATAFRNSDDGFSYLYNLNTEVGGKAYEDILHGNVIASDQISKKHPHNLVELAPILKVSTFTSLNTGRFVSVSLGLPILWNSGYSKGNINSYTSTDFHINNKTARVHYGIYSKTKNLHLWTRHRETDLMFYGAKYFIDSPEGNDDGTFGRYTYAYRNEGATPRRIQKSVASLIQHTGIDDLAVAIPDEDRLGYAGIEFNTTLHDDNTERLMSAARKNNENYFLTIGDRYYSDYRAHGDTYNYCLGPATPICWDHLLSESHEALRDMHHYLEEMASFRDQDAKAYAAAYGRFGRAMTKNHIAFRAALELAGPGADISYLIEGAKISMYYKAWRTTRTANKWELTDNPNSNGSYPFEPRLRHSQIQGLIVNPGLGGIETFNNLTSNLEPPPEIPY